MRKSTLLFVLAFAAALSLPMLAFADEPVASGDASDSGKTTLAVPSEEPWTYTVQVAWGEGVVPRPVYVSMFDQWGHTFTEEDGWCFPLTITSDIAPNDLAFGKDVAEIRHAGTYVDDEGVVRGIEREDGRFDVRYSVEADEATHTAVITVTNNYRDVELVSIPVSIVWDDGDNAAGMRPTGWSFDITMNGQWSPNSVYLQKSNGWTSAIEDWEAFDEDGKAIEYGIYWFEDSWLRAQGYTAVLSGSMAEGYTIECTFDPDLVNWEILAQGPPDRGSGAGALATGWIKTGNEWRYVKDGALMTGWQRIDGDWYLLQGPNSGQDTGLMLTGWQKVGGTWYYMAKSGRMATGWQKIGDTWYYLKPSGAMATGWVKDKGSWYYLDKSGKMQTGWLELNTQKGAKRYLLAASGRMQTGWAKSDGNWYYLLPTGETAHGWQKIDGSWYFFAGAGEMWKNVWTGNGDGYLYHLGANGKWDGGKQLEPRDM